MNARKLIALLSIILIIVSITLILVSVTDSQPGVEYLGENVKLGPGIYLIKGEREQLKNVGAGPVYEIPCSSRGFAWLRVEDSFEVEMGAWRFTTLRNPDVIVGTCNEFQQYHIGSMATGDTMECVGIDLKNNEEDIRLYARGHDWGGYLVTWIHGGEEPAYAEYRMEKEFNGLADIYIVGDGSSAWWCKIYQATPVPTNTPEPTNTLQPTVVGETQVPTLTPTVIVITGITPTPTPDYRWAVLLPAVFHPYPPPPPPMIRGE